MNKDWADQDLTFPTKGARDIAVGLVRFLSVGATIFLGLFLLLLLRLIEAPIFRAHRPWTPYLTVAVCRTCLAILGLPVMCDGQTMKQHGAIVTNHSSWLDIFVLNSRKRVYFVAKAEVSGWPVIGWLARATGTVFIERKKSQAQIHNRILAERLRQGHKLLFFPEGTSTDAIRVLPFKSTLFQTFLGIAQTDEIWVQAVTTRYIAPKGEEPRYYGWWGDMRFLPSLWMICCTRHQGRVELTYHDPIRVTASSDRKQLAQATEDLVRSGFERE